MKAAAAKANPPTPIIELTVAVTKVLVWERRAP
jgi:hypothetical protein